MFLFVSVQMPTSALMALITVILMPSVKTHQKPTTASASQGTKEMGSIVKVSEVLSTFSSLTLVFSSLFVIESSTSAFHPFFFSTKRQYEICCNLFTVVDMFLQDELLV